MIKFAIEYCYLHDLHRIVVRSPIRLHILPMLLQLFMEVVSNGVGASQLALVLQDSASVTGSKAHSLGHQDMTEVLLPCLHSVLQVANPYQIKNVFAPSWKMQVYGCRLLDEI